MKEYEEKVKYLQYENSQLNFEYEQSFAVFWERDNSYKELEQYRLTICQKINQNNSDIRYWEKKMRTQHCIYKLLYKCFYFANKAKY